MDELVKLLHDRHSFSLVYMHAHVIQMASTMNVYMKHVHLKTIQSALNFFLLKSI